jgi:NADPH:quinone reductase-like Zn-dependent oxidoreductase
LKAITYVNYGLPDVLQLQQVPKPVPKANEMLVKIYASSINSWDWDMLIGKPWLSRMLSGIFKPKYNILGADIAGVVEEVGTGIKKFKPCDEVFGDIANAGFGAFAEYAIAPEKLLAKKTEWLSFEQAAALPHAGLPALQGLCY